MYMTAYTNAQAPKWCLEIDKFDILGYTPFKVKTNHGNIFGNLFGNLSK